MACVFPVHLCTIAQVLPGSVPDVLCYLSDLDSFEDLPYTSTPLSVQLAVGS